MTRIHSVSPRVETLPAQPASSSAAPARTLAEVPIGPIEPHHEGLLARLGRALGPLKNAGAAAGVLATVIGTTPVSAAALSMLPVAPSAEVGVGSSVGAPVVHGDPAEIRRANRIADAFRAGRRFQSPGVFFMTRRELDEIVAMARRDAVEAGVVDGGVTRAQRSALALQWAVLNRSADGQATAITAGARRRYAELQRELQLPVYP